MTLLIGILLLLAPTADPYLQEIAKWRTEREERLKTDTGWLTVTGLHWLEQGRNPVGASPGAAVVLPKPAPPEVGVITLNGRKAEFEPAPGVKVTSKGQPVGRTALDPGVPLELGSLTFFIIERASRVGVRVRDTNSEARRNFHGLSWYDADPRWRIRARLEPPAAGRTVPIGTIVGDRIDLESAGHVVFTIEGRELRLEAVFDAPEREELFVMFKDRTNGETTYGAGRYMYLPLPENGIVDLDFNKAYNPPCAFTEFATCPLPPRQNWLPVPIEAGEKSYSRR